MRRRVLIPLLLVLAAALAYLVAVPALGRLRPAGGPVFSLSQVEEGLRRHPGQWVGRTIRLRALVTWQPLTCSAGMPQDCAGIFPLTEYAPDGSATSILQTVMISDLLFIHLEPDPFLDRLRALPGIGRLVPGPQPLPDRGIFTVQLQQAPAGFPCGPGACYWAVVRDAGPAGPLYVSHGGISLDRHVRKPH